MREQIIKAIDFAIGVLLVGLFVAVLVLGIPIAAAVLGMD